VRWNALRASYNSPFSGMDEAIVMGYACNTIAFNVIISISEEGTDRARFVEQINREIPEAEVIRCRAACHRSAMLM